MRVDFDLTPLSIRVSYALLSFKSSGLADCDFLIISSCGWEFDDLCNDLRSDSIKTVRINGLSAPPECERVLA